MVMVDCCIEERIEISYVFIINMDNKVEEKFFMKKIDKIYRKLRDCFLLR